MYRICGLKLCLSILASLISIGGPVSSQEVKYELVASGLLTHSIHGKGIVMRIKPSSMPQGGLEGDIIQQAMVQICRHYAPSVIPFVIEETDLSEPEFVAVRIISGNSVFGRYILKAYEIENGTCGGEL